MCTPSLYAVEVSNTSGEPVVLSITPDLAPDLQAEGFEVRIEYSSSTGRDDFVILEKDGFGMKISKGIEFYVGKDKDSRRKFKVFVREDLEVGVMVSRTPRGRRRVSLLVGVDVRLGKDMFTVRVLYNQWRAPVLIDKTTGKMAAYLSEHHVFTNLGGVDWMLCETSTKTKEFDRALQSRARAWDASVLGAWECVLFNIVERYMDTYDEKLCEFVGKYIGHRAPRAVNTNDGELHVLAALLRERDLFLLSPAWRAVLLKTSNSVARKGFGVVPSLFEMTHKQLRALHVASDALAQKALQSVDKKLAVDILKTVGGVPLVLLPEKAGAWSPALETRFTNIACRDSDVAEHLQPVLADVLLVYYLHRNSPLLPRGWLASTLGGLFRRNVSPDEMSMFMERIFEFDKLALAMGRHARLGEASLLRQLPAEIFSAIVAKSFE